MVRFELAFTVETNGTSLGGLEWGSAYDGQRIYTAEADPFGIPHNPCRPDDPRLTRC
jgi:hypothetical protein